MNRGPWQKLHQYQKEGVRWLWGLFQDSIGGVLGDEMGLGKVAIFLSSFILKSINYSFENTLQTAQLCVHYGTIAQSGLKLEGNRCQSNQKFLIVCPATVLQHWNNEMNTWNPQCRVLIMHSISPTFNEIQSLGSDGIKLALEEVFSQPISRHGTVVITSYGTFRCMIFHIQAYIHISPWMRSNQVPFNLINSQ